MSVAEEPRGVRRRPTRGFGLSHLLALVGGIAVIVALFLKWEDLSFAGHQSTSKAKDVPLKFLFDYTTKSKDPSLVLILVIAAALILAGALLGGWLIGGRFLVLIGGLLAVAIAVVYSFQVHQVLHVLHLGNQVGVTDFVGPAPYVALAGGILALIATFVPTRRGRRSDYDVPRTPARG